MGNRKFYLRNFVVRDHLKNKRSLEYDIKTDRREVDFGAGEKMTLDTVNTTIPRSKQRECVADFTYIANDANRTELRS
jgi:hypothetical protein